MDGRSVSQRAGSWNNFRNQAAEESLSRAFGDGDDDGDHPVLIRWR